MGYSLAKEAYAFGGQVTLISAPTCLNLPSQIKKIDVVSAIDMFEAIKDIYQGFDIIIMNAAVADFRPKAYSENKLKKQKKILQ
jgi:Phosphopantothenoylcysteine synthetase/decarboxylase